MYFIITLYLYYYFLLQRIKERDNRRATVAQKLEQQFQEKLKASIRERGVKIRGEYQYYNEMLSQ